MALKIKELYRFEEYLLDTAERQVRRREEPVPVSPRAFDTLLYMLRNPGRLLSKDELLKELWPDTFVEEVNLAVHVSTLRKALGDSAQDPRFIETVAGRGYRFVCAVEKVEEEEGQIVARESGTSDAATKLDGELGPSPQEQTRLGRMWRTWTAALVLAVCIGGGFWLSHKRSGASSASLTQKDSVLLGAFANTTGEEVFDGSLREGLAVDLGQSPFLKVVSNERERETLRFMGKPAEEKIGDELLREMCQRVDAKALVRGSIGRVGEKYELTLEAVGCQSAEELAREQIEARKKEEVLPRMGEAAARFRTKLGESLTSVEQFDVPLEKATTTSLEALKSYSLGVEQRRDGKEKEAIPFFEHAVELDSHFAMARAQLGTAYGNLGETERAAGYFGQAFAERDKLSERERLYLTVKYHTQVTGDITKATETYEVWSKLYPRDWSPFNGLSARCQVVGKYEKAVAAAQEALRLEPNHYLPYANLAGSLLALNRFAEAREVCKRAEAAHRDSFYTHRALFEMALIQQDPGGMEKELAWSRQTERENDMLNTQGFALLSQGKVRAALKCFERSWEESKRRGLRDNAAYSMAGLALTEADFGLKQEARAEAEESLRMGQGIDTEETAAEALAIAGEEQRAKTLSEELRKRYPLHVVLVNASLPTIEASREVARGNAAEAVRLLEQAREWDLCEFSGLSPVYVRGVALLRWHKGQEAAVEFQKIVDNPGIAPTSNRHAQAILGLARAYEMSGEREKSRKAYEEFLKLWKNADENVPILKEARAEYAALAKK